MLPNFLPRYLATLPTDAGIVSIRRDLTADRLSVLTLAHEIKLGAIFFAWVYDSYLLLRCHRIRIGCKLRCAGLC